MSTGFFKKLFSQKTITSTGSIVNQTTDVAILKLKDDKLDPKEFLTIYHQQIQEFIQTKKFSSLNYFLDELKKGSNYHLNALKKQSYDFSVYLSDALSNDHAPDEQRESFFRMMELGFFDENMAYYKAFKIGFSTITMTIMPYERALNFLSSEQNKSKLEHTFKIILDAIKRDKKIKYHKEMYLAESKKVSNEIYLDNFLSDIEKVCLSSGISNLVAPPIKPKLL